MTTLLLKLKDGTIIKGKAVAHCLLAEKHEIDFNDIVAVGFLIKDRELWDNRKPH